MTPVSSSLFTHRLPSAPVSSHGYISTKVLGHKINIALYQSRIQSFCACYNCLLSDALDFCLFEVLEPDSEPILTSNGI